MTTVGYGDKSHRTTGGRIIRLIWMFMAIIIISSLTAGIASSLTVQTMNDEITGVQDLSKFEVLPKTLKKDYYGFSFPKNSALLNKIDPVLIGVMKTTEWKTILADYK